MHGWAAGVGDKLEMGGVHFTILDTDSPTLTQSDRRERRRTLRISGWSVCEIVCVVEAPAVLSMATLLACGQWGPYALPHTIHLLFCSGLVFGLNNYTAVVLTLYMREQTQHGSTMRPDGSFWRYVKSARTTSDVCLCWILTSRLPPGGTEGICGFSSSFST